MRSALARWRGGCFDRRRVTGQAAPAIRSTPWSSPTIPSYLGLPVALREDDPAIVADPNGKKLADAIKQGGDAGYKVFHDLADSLSGYPMNSRYRPAY